MKELIFTKPSQLGEIKVIMRINRHLLYFKYNFSQYAEAAIKSFEQKGVKFRKGNGWLEVDIFRDNNVINLGTYEIDLEEDKQDEIENKLAEFYTIQYVKNGFKLL